MGRILKIAQREYVETAKTKMFILSIVLMPIIMVGAMAFSGYTQNKAATGARPTRTVAAVVASDGLWSALDETFADHNRSHDQRQIVIERHEPDGDDTDVLVKKLKQGVRKNDLDGLLVVVEDVVDGKGSAQFYTKRVTDMDFFKNVQRMLNRTVTDERLVARNLSPALISKLRRSVPLDQIDMSGGTEKEGNAIARLMVPFFFLFMMFMGIYGSSVGMLTSVIEEKTSRVMEVLLSAVTPFQLMAGKILGLSGLALTILSIWATAACIAAVATGMTDIIDMRGIGYFLVYFLFGFVLLSSMFAAVGSACSTIKDAQPLMMPIFLLLMTPMMLWLPIAQQPEGTLATVMSFIPPITPMVMILRIAAWPDLPMAQIVASILLLMVSVPATVWASSRIFRVGTLMYGKPPSQWELLRWLWYK